MIPMRLVSSHLFRDACKSLSHAHPHAHAQARSLICHPSIVLASGLSKVVGGHGTVNLNNNRVLANASICIPASHNYHETTANPNSSQMKKKEASILKRKEKQAAKKAREAAHLELFEAWSKKYGKTYSSKKNKTYMFKVFQANYESMNDKNVLPPEKLVMPLFRHFYASLLPEDFDYHSPLAKLHKRGQWPGQY
ncbi:hypothetical protein OROHE_008731 [Orobanche hederae]